jgi:hypothetical protein
LKGDRGYPCRLSLLPLLATVVFGGGRQASASGISVRGGGRGETANGPGPPEAERTVGECLILSSVPGTSIVANQPTATNWPSGNPLPGAGRPRVSDPGSQLPRPAGGGGSVDVPCPHRPVACGIIKVSEKPVKLGKGR